MAFLLVLSTLMLPVQVTIVPLYILWVRVGQIGHLTPLILPSFLGDAFSIFLLRQFFLTIPQELSDAARVDGASEFQIMTRVIVPLAKPAIAAVALFNFLYNWNDLFSPLLFLGENQKLWTLTLGLTQFQQRHGTEWNLTMAASVMIMVPVIVLFFLAQTSLRRGRDAHRRQGLARPLTRVALFGCGWIQDFHARGVLAARRRDRRRREPPRGNGGGVRPTSCHPARDHRLGSPRGRSRGRGGRSSRHRTRCTPRSPSPCSATAST